MGSSPNKNSLLRCNKVHRYQSKVIFFVLCSFLCSFMFFAYNIVNCPHCFMLLRNINIVFLEKYF